MKSVFSTIAYLILILNCVTFFPNDISMHLIGHGIGCMSFFMGISLKIIKLKINDYRFMIAFIVPVGLFLLIQCLYLQSAEPLKYCLAWFMAIVTIVFLGKMLSLKRIVTILCIILLLNDICAIIWNMFGTYGLIEFKGKLLYYVSFFSIKQPIFFFESELGIIPRLAGFFPNPNQIGFIVIIIYAGLDFINEKNKKTLFLLAASIILSQSRSALLFIALYYGIKIFLQTGKTFCSKILSLGLLMAIIVVNFIMTLMRGGDNDVSSGRFNMISIVIKQYTSNDILTQLLGIGVGKHNEYLWRELMLSFPLDNSYLSILIDLGLVGAVVIFSSIIIYIITTYKKRSVIKQMIPYLFGLIVYAFFEDVIFSNRSVVFYGLYIYNMTKFRDVRENI